MWIYKIESLDQRKVISLELIKHGLTGCSKCQSSQIKIETELVDYHFSYNFTRDTSGKHMGSSEMAVGLGEPQMDP